MGALSEPQLERLFTMTGEVNLTRKIEPYLTGETEIYDPTLFERIIDPSDVAGYRILDIGSMGLGSSGDFVKTGAREVVVVEPFPFGIGQKIEAGLEELVALHADIKGYDPKKIKVVQEYAGREFDVASLGIFERAFFFFPAIPLIGNYPEYTQCPEIGLEFRKLVLDTCKSLNQKGIFSLITEVSEDKLRRVELPGFDRSTKRFSGKELYSEAQRVHGWKTRSRGTKILRPAKDLGVTLLQYKGNLDRKH